MTEINSIYAPTPFAVAKGGTGNSTTLTNGQLWIGNGTATPSIGTITAGTNVIVTNASGTITIAATTPAATVLANPTSSVALQGNTTYIPTNTSIGITTFTLPVSPTIGEFYKIIGSGSQGWIVNLNPSQIMQVGTTQTGTGGSIQSVNPQDSVIIYCQSSVLFLAIPLCGQLLYS